jgi:hypothetical protein
MNSKEFLDKIESILHEINLWGLKIEREDPVIVVTGGRQMLIWLCKDLFDLDNQGATELNHFLDYFEIDIDFEEGFISFFMKKEYTKN